MKFGNGLMVATGGFLLLCTAASWQASLGTKNGSVLDRNTAILVGARLTVMDIQRGFFHSLVPNTADEYIFASGLPETYVVIQPRAPTGRKGSEQHAERRFLPLVYAIGSKIPVPVSQSLQYESGFEGRSGMLKAAA